MSYQKLTDLHLKNKRVLIREDFNVPMKDGLIQDDTRIRAAIPTIQYALDQGAAVILMSHLGRPTETIDPAAVETRFIASRDEVASRGIASPLDSLLPVSQRLSELLQKPVHFISDWINGFSINSGDIVLCENTRFLIGEKKCNPQLSQKMANLCDVFVMDAFATAHRAESSTAGVVLAYYWMQN